jgi:hypothetical protein
LAVVVSCKKEIRGLQPGDMAAISFSFAKPANGSDSHRELAYWAAATTHNSVIEFRAYSTEFGLPLPPADLRIFVTNWGNARATGSTVMFNKCHNNTIPVVLTAFFLATGSANAAAAVALAAILKNRVDMTINYLAPLGDYNCLLTSASLKRIVYHELGHAQHYQQVGCDFWTSYRNAIITELTKLNQADLQPYGTGNDASTAPIIATGEM